MPTIEEIDAAIARKRAQQASGPTLEEIDAAIARKKAQEPRGFVQGAKDMARGAYDYVAGAIRGNASEQLPDVFGSQFAEQAKSLRAAQGRGDFMGSAKLSAAAMFGDDADIGSAITREFPGAKIEQDANGNPVAVMPDGQRYYVNQPGLDANDVGRFAGKMLSFIPAAKVAGLGGGLLARAGIGGAASGITDVGMQKLAGRDDVDVGQTALTAGAGAAAEFAAPVINWGLKKVRGALNSKAGQLAVGQDIARKAGLTVTEPDDFIALAAAKEQIDAGADPLAIIAESRHGFKLSAGQKTDSRAQLLTEDYARSVDPDGPLAQLGERNFAQHQQNLRDMRTAIAGGEPVTEQEAARRVHDALKAAERAERGKVTAAYAKAQKLGGGVLASGEDFARIPQQIDDAFNARIYVSELSTPRTFAARQVLNQAAAKAKDGTLSLMDLENIRKDMGAYRANIKDAADERAMAALFREYDKGVNEAITRQLADKGEEALSALKDARSVASRYFGHFQANTPAGKQITKLLVDEMTPEEVANVLLGANGVNKLGAASIASRYLKAVGKESDGAKALRDIVGRRLLEPKPGMGLSQSAGDIERMLREATEGKGATLMNTLFTKPELSVLKDYQQIMRRFFMAKPDDFGRAGSRTSKTPAIAAFFQKLGNSTLAKTPLAGVIVEKINTVAGRAAGNAALAGPSLPRPAVIPAAGVAAGVTYMGEDEEDRRR